MERDVGRRSALRIKVFADGADLKGILELAADPLISGFTTNPTLMRRAGIEDYEAFARKVLDHVRDDRSPSRCARMIDETRRSAPTLLMGTECLRQNPGDEHGRGQFQSSHRRSHG